ncbi:MAG: hypothetical protein KJN90_13665 [Gammaproteobacteria bacterium]|nr:hypothetical protein [Gammaproteobacteria bacterium]
MENSFNWRSLDIRLLSAGISLLLTGALALFGWIPNEDAFTYIRTVEIFNSEGLLAAFRHYPWATFSLLVAFVNNLFNIEPLTAAILVNAVFFSLLVYSFISLVAEIDNKRLTLILAAITVLVYPQLNEYRLVVIRDTAYWALALFGLWQFVRYMESYRPVNGILFLSAFLLAAAFRVESVFFLFAIPLSLLIDERLRFLARVKQAALFTASSAIILGLLAFLLSLLGLGIPQLIAEQLAGYVPFINDTLFPTEIRNAEMSRAIFGDYAANFSADYLPLFMVTGLLAVMTTYLFRGIGGPFLIIMLSGIVSRTWRIPVRQSAPLLTVIMVNGLIALGFLVATRFLSTRYVMLLCIVLALFVPLLLSRILTMALAKHQRFIPKLMGLLLFYCAVDAYISFGADRSYLREAGDWMAQNTPESTTILTNNRVVAYYSNRVEDYDELQITLTEDDILQLTSGNLIGFEEDSSTVGLFDREAVRSAVEEVIRFGDDESRRQLIIYSRL